MGSEHHYQNNTKTCSCCSKNPKLRLPNSTPRCLKTLLQLSLAPRNHHLFHISSDGRFPVSEGTQKLYFFIRETAGLLLFSYRKEVCHSRCERTKQQTSNPGAEYKNSSDLKQKYQTTLTSSKPMIILEILIINLSGKLTFLHCINSSTNYLVKNIRYGI